MIYASNLKGTCILAYDGWKDAFDRSYKSGYTDPERHVFAVQARVYARIVRHITGRAPGWFTDRKALLGHLGA